MRIRWVCCIQITTEVWNYPLFLIEIVFKVNFCMLGRLTLKFILLTGIKGNWFIKNLFSGRT